MTGPEKGDGPRKWPKFNVYWVYAIIAAVLLSAQFMKFAPELTPTYELEFKQNMLLKGDVERLDLVKNKDKVRVYIKPDSLYKDFYRNKFKTVISKRRSGVYLFLNLK